MTLDAPAFLATVVLGVLVGLVLLRLLRLRGGRLGSGAAMVVAIVAVSLSLAGIAELTLFGREGLGAEQRLELHPLVGARGWAGVAWRPVLDNVTLFVPLGASLAALWHRRHWGLLVAVAGAVSIGVELFQWSFPTGRIANTADVIANTVGATIGVGLARLVQPVRSTSSKRSPDVSSRRR